LIGEVGERDIGSEGWWASERIPFRRRREGRRKGEAVIFMISGTVTLSSETAKEAPRGRKETEITD
jgi:hypothetical protein